jgi:ADP-ribosyl-[dinitrogen reductase] hydrolase
LRARIVAFVESLEAQRSPEEFANSQGWTRGISGYVNQTVPGALYCWAHAKNFRQCVTDAVLLGGDTDTVAAIAGAVCGANLGVEQLPQTWSDALAERPRTVEWMEQLAQHGENGSGGNPPAMCWLATIPSNVLFTASVLGIGFRRLVFSF